MNATYLKTLLFSCLFFIQLTNITTVFAKSGGGAVAGGGGDASEARVDEIRSDILKWINDGGAEGLTLKNISYGEYKSKMTEVLQPKIVIVNFIEKDHATDEELQVNVDGKPKTCRSFISSRNSSYNILCNISRFKETTDSNQYKLIHHEFAGLMFIEKNEGAASDYEISSQITEFLSKQFVLKLAIKKQVKIKNEDANAQVFLASSKYVGKNIIEVKLAVSNTDGLAQIILVATSACSTLPKQLIITNENFDVSFKVNKKECSKITYGNIMAQYLDGSFMALDPVELNFSSLRILNDNKFLQAKGKLISTEEVRDQSTAKKAKIYHYEASFNVKPQDLVQYSGVRIEGTTEGAIEGEFFSENASELAAFINEKNFTFKRKFIEFNKDQYSPVAYTAGENTTYIILIKKSDVLAEERIHFNFLVDMPKEKTESSHAQNDGYENLSIGTDKDIKCIQSIEKLSCGPGDDEFPGQTTYSCEFKVLYKNDKNQIKEVLGSGSAQPTSTDRGVVKGIGAFLFNIVETPVRALVRARANRMTVIKYTESKFPACKN